MAYTCQTENDVASKPQQTNATFLDVDNSKIIWNNTHKISMCGENEIESIHSQQRKQNHQDEKEQVNENINSKEWNGTKALVGVGVGGVGAATAVAGGYAAGQMAMSAALLASAGGSVAPTTMAAYSAAYIGTAIGDVVFSGGLWSLTGAFVETANFGVQAAAGAASLGYGAVAVASLVSGAAGLAAIGVAGKYAYNKYNDSRERKEFNKVAKEYNKKVEECNKIIQSLKNITKEIEEGCSKLEKDELLRSAHAIKELFGDNNKRRIIIVIGPTGYGKSLVCNRLFGDDSKIKKINGDENRLFTVGTLGKGKSETSKMKMVSSDIKIIAAADTEKKEFKFYVTDTPGAADSEGKDELYDEQMVEFCKITGGVNAFLLFFKFGCVVDNNYKKLLEKYHKLWGDKFWKYCIIVVTKCERNMAEGWDGDDEKKFQEGIDDTVKAITNALNKISGNQFGKTCKEKIFTFGIRPNEWKPSVLKLFLKLYDDYQVIYKPEHKQTPLEKLCYQQKEEAKKFTEVAKELKGLEEKMGEQKKKIEN